MSSFYDEPITVDTITVHTIARALNKEKNKDILQNIADLKKQKDNILQKISKELEKEIEEEAEFLGKKLGLTYVGMGDVSVVYQDETTKKVFKILYNFNQKKNEIESLEILDNIKSKKIKYVVFPKNSVDDPTLIVEYPWCESLDNKLLNDDPILLDSMIDFNFKLLHATLISLHNNGIYHKDIKIDNIGYCNNVLKLNDFGKAIKYNGNNNDFKKINAQSDFDDLLTAYIDSKKILLKISKEIDKNYKNSETYKLLIKSVSDDYKYSGGKRRNRRRHRRRPTRRKRNTKQKKRSRRSKRSKKTT
jgi:serine/threonine protein kinase